ncbi:MULTISPECIES: VWA domain-containing protein [unclassified Pantoea]|uniref:VWA domain-containing protein n=1 Tax=unclassified Pantoea TaxID=2630326 RepID=UPI00301E4211
MNAFHILHPWWLTGLPLCLGLAWWLRRTDSQWSRILTKPFHLLIIGKRLPARALLPWLLATGFVALAGPSWHKQPPAGESPQSNVMVVLQQDLSMLAQDLPPNRHERMQHKLTLLMQQLPGSRFGLVVYRAGAWLTTPMTTDPTFYTLFLQAQQPTLLPDSDGDGLQPALALAEKNLPASPRSILLIADSLSATDVSLLNNTTLPIQLWVPGTARGGALPEALAQRGIDTRLNVARFKQIQQHGLPVTLATIDDDDLVSIRRHIRQTVIAEQNDRVDLPWHNSGYLLIPLMLLLSLLWRRQVVAAWAILSWIWIAPPAHASLIDRFIRPDMQGQQAFKRGDYTSAARHYQDPLRRGIALYYAGDFAGASAAFRLVPPTPESLLWAGNCEAQLKHWQQALNIYDQALSLRPGWPMAQQNRASIAKIVMQLRQKERDRQDAQGKEQEESADAIKKDLAKNQGVMQKDMQPLQQASPQINQWYQNLILSPSGLLENLYHSESP